jgi:hypothetical protein
LTSITIGSSSDGEDGNDSSQHLDPALLAIRSGFKHRRGLNNDSDFEIVESPRATSAKKTKSGSTTGGIDDTIITVSLRMVFDPTIVSASTMVKQAYEKEEKFEIGIVSFFSPLACTLSPDLDK